MSTAHPTSSLQIVQRSTPSAKSQRQNKKGGPIATRRGGENQFCLDTCARIICSEFCVAAFGEIADQLVMKVVELCGNLRLHTLLIHLTRTVDSFAQPV